MSAPPPIVRNDGTGHYLVRLLRFDSEALERIRGIGGRRWSPEKKAWRIPAQPNTAALLKRLFPGILLPEERKPAEAAAAPETPSVETLEEMAHSMVLAGFSPRTRKVYLGYARRFARWIGTPLQEAGLEEVRRYLVHLVEERGVSRSAHSQAVSALRFLFEKVLRRPQVIRDIPRPKKQASLPAVLSRQEVDALLKAVRHPSSRAC